LPDKRLALVAYGSDREFNRVKNSTRYFTRVLLVSRDKGYISAMRPALRA